MVFGLFKSKQPSFSEEDLIRQICNTEDLIAKIYGIPNLTSGQRLRLKLSLLCTILGIVISSHQDLQKKKYFIDKTVTLFSKSSKKIDKLNLAK